MSVRQRFDEWRARSTPRERALVVAGALVVLAALLYWTAVPLVQALDRQREALAAARAQVGHMTGVANEIAGLVRDVKPPRTAQPRAAAERVVAEMHSRGLLTSLESDERGVRLTFDGIDFDTFARVVDRLGRDEQLFPVEALVAARVEPGRVRAEVVLARPQ